MGRLERFLKYEFARWPDDGLRAVVDAFRRPVVTRVEQRFDSGLALVVELLDAGAPEDTRPTVRLSWDASHGQIFALEVYEEFYSGPYARAYAWKRGTERRFLHEIVNDPSPWIEELLDDNPAVGVFPPSGAPVAARNDTRALNPSWPEPSGRFYRPGTPTVGEGVDVLISPGPEASPEDWARAQEQGRRMREQWGAGQRATPRYRHLFIASDSSMVEVLCGGLPSWEIVGREAVL